MERLTKRVGVDEAVPICDFDICKPFAKCGYCKTGSQGFPGSKWERHCNDTCILGRMIDRLADYEDTGLTLEEVKETVQQIDTIVHAIVEALPDIITATVDKIIERLRACKETGL